MVLICSSSTPRFCANCIRIIVLSVHQLSTFLQRKLTGPPLRRFLRYSDRIPLSLVSNRISSPKSRQFRFKPLGSFIRLSERFEQLGSFRLEYQLTMITSCQLTVSSLPFWASLSAMADSASLASILSNSALALSRASCFWTSALACTRHT
jgi:hypothetical protein